MLLLNQLTVPPVEARTNGRCQQRRYPPLAGQCRDRGRFRIEDRHSRGRGCVQLACQNTPGGSVVRCYRKWLLHFKSIDWHGKGQLAWQMDSSAVTLSQSGVALLLYSPAPTPRTCSASYTPKLCPACLSLLSSSPPLLLSVIHTAFMLCLRPR